MSERLNTSQFEQLPNYEQNQLDLSEFPVGKKEHEIREKIRNNPSCIVVGETGSGKTTIIPEILMREFPEARIAVTQPRIIAAKSVSQCVSQRRSLQFGADSAKQIAYQTRHENNLTEHTRTIFMTDGILLRKLQNDSLLSDHDVVMIDEAHERSLNIDFILGLLKKVQENRREAGMAELKIVVTSATIEKEKFAEYFSNSPILEVEGRMFPVEVSYETRESIQKHMEVVDRYGNEEYNYISAATEKVEQIVASGQDGDILIFMPTTKDINAMLANLEDLNLYDVEIMALHANLKPDEQYNVFRKSKKRKIIVSTNIAETSVTIDGIKFVIDSGLINQKEFDAQSGIESLRPRLHAKAGCNQRMGRAGRTAPGQCIRLYTKQNFESRNDFSKPEIQRSDLAHVVLQMKKMSIENIQDFDFIDKPDSDTIVRAIEVLQMLGALDENEKITSIGEQMADIPLKPELARMVLEAEKFHCVSSICTIASLLDLQKPIFLWDKDPEKDKKMKQAQAQFKDPNSDFLTLLLVYKQWSASGFDKNWARAHYLNFEQLKIARDNRSQLMYELGRSGYSEEGIDYDEKEVVAEDKNGDSESVQKCITAGLINNLMVGRGDFSYKRVVDKRGADDNIYIHPSSNLINRAPEFMIGVGVRSTSKTFAQKCQAVNPEWLVQVAPQVLKVSEKYSYYDSSKDCVVEYKGYSLSGHQRKLASKIDKVNDPAIAEEVFAGAVISESLDLAFKKKNNVVIEKVKSLYKRSGGAVELPDQYAWYKQRLSGISSVAELQENESQFEMKLSDFCSDEKVFEIEKLYPLQVNLHGLDVNIIYEFKQADPYSYFDKQEKFFAVVDVPREIIDDLDESDALIIGENGRPKVCYRLDNSTRFSSITELKDAFNKEKLSNAWANFHGKESGKLIDGHDLNPWPSLESLGLTPVVYTKDRSGNDVFVYPAIKAVKDYSNGGYRYFVGYFQSNQDAQSCNQTSQRVKEMQDVQEKSKTERQEKSASIKLKYEELREVLSQMQINQNYTEFGLDYSSFDDLKRNLRQAKNILDDESQNLKDALDLLTNIAIELKRAKEQKENQKVLVKEQQQRIQDMLESVQEINYENYQVVGLSLEQFNQIQEDWQVAVNCLEDVYYRQKDPVKAKAMLDRIEETIVNAKPKSKEENLADILNKYKDKEKEKNINRKSKSGNTEQGNVEKENSLDPEKMTDELLENLLGQLNQAKILIDDVANTEKLNEKEKEAKRKNKIVDRADELRIVWRKLKDEVKASDNYSSMRGKVLEILRKSEKLVEEMAHIEGTNKSWPERYNSLKDYVRENAREIAQALELEINDAQIKSVILKMKPELLKIAKSNNDQIGFEKISNKIEDLVTQVLS